MSKILKLPVYHLDSFYWKPGWVPTAYDEWIPIAKDLASRDEWIIDGGYSSTLDDRLKRADLVILLDMPRYLCMYRIIKRRLEYRGKTRPDMGQGCPEKLDWEFISWVFNYNKRVKPKILEKIDRLGVADKLVTLKSQREVDSYLASLGRQEPS